MTARAAPAEVYRLLEAASAPGATAGDVDAARHAVNALFAEHQERVYWLCLRLVGDPQRAAELTQDTMLVAFRRFDEFRPEESFFAWLFGIARNLCRRSLARKADLLAEDGVLEPADPARGALNALRRQERDAVLDAAVATLEPQEQEALHLRYVEGVGVDEITALLGLTERSGARGVLQRCRRKLRVELARRLEALGHGDSLVLGSVEEGT